jgi:steroid 5-alpha reductase family enzyme
VLLVPPPESTRPSQLAGVALVLAGEAIRLWGVRHIGAISRTRSDRLGPLVATGPFALVRNPLYIGNIVLWIGFALSAGAPWLAPIVGTLLLFEYHAIARWEEQLLTERLGEAYRRYRAEVPRWIPRGFQSLGPPSQPRPDGSAAVGHFSWRDTLYSERGTLIAIAAGYFLLWLKSRV